MAMHRDGTGGAGDSHRRRYQRPTKLKGTVYRVSVRLDSPAVRNLEAFRKKRRKTRSGAIRFILGHPQLLSFLFPHEPHPGV